MKKKLFKIHTLAFFLPIIIFTAICAILKIFPFGENTLLSSDMYYQYAPFFLFFKRLFTRDASLFYTFNAGLGTPVIDLFSYYLASPLNLILLFFSEANITEGILVLILLKLGLCGLTASLFIHTSIIFKKYTFEKISTTLIFSLCYALMSYTVLYFFNIMWLDAVYMLPLICLGIEKLILKKKPFLFYITLFIAVFSNWYTGFMLCIFSSLYCLYILFSFDIERKVKHMLNLIIFGVLSVLSSAVMLLPSFNLFLQNSGRFTSNNFTFEINFTLFDFFSKFIIGGSNFDQITNSASNKNCLDLPNIYCSLFILILSVCFFFNKQIAPKEKVIDTILLLTLFISFLLKPLNTIWHCMSFNIWFPYRYSFIFTFIMIIIALKSYLTLKDFPQKTLLKIYLVSIFVIVLIEKFNYTYINSEKIFFTLIILSIITLFIYLKISNKTTLDITTLTLEFIVFEFLITYSLILATYPFPSRHEFYEILNNKFNISNNEDFYRISVDNIDYPNLGLALDFNTNIYSSSTLNSNVHDFFEKSGFSALSNMINSGGNTPVTNMLLCANYTANYDKTIPTIKSNKSALPIGFLVNDTIQDINLENDNPFEFQNAIIKNMVGTNQNIFNKIKTEKSQEQNVIKNEDTYEKLTKAPATFTYIATIPQNTDIYLYSLYPYNNYSISVNNTIIDDVFGIVNLGKFDTPVITIQLSFNNDVIKLKEPLLYSFDENSFAKSYQLLSKSPLTLKHFTDTYISGEITVHSENEILFTSIPYSYGWSIKIDGQEVDLTKTLNTFIAAKIPIGTHLIELSYLPKSIIWGSFISLITIILSIYLCFYCKKLHKLI